MASAQVGIDGQRVVTNRLLTVAEVAEILQVNPAWVRNHASRSRPRIPCVRLGKHLRFKQQDVEDFIDLCNQITERQK